MKNTKQNTSKTKSKSKYTGRKPGSFSFTKVTMLDLMNKFSDPNFEVPISSKWATMLGFTNVTPLSTSQVVGPIKAKTETAAAVTVTDLDAPVSA